MELDREDIPKKHHGTEYWSLQGGCTENKWQTTYHTRTLGRVNEHSQSAVHRTATSFQNQSLPLLIRSLSERTWEPTLSTCVLTSYRLKEPILHSLWGLWRGFSVITLPDLNNSRWNLVCTCVHQWKISDFFVQGFSRPPKQLKGVISSRVLMMGSAAQKAQFCAMEMGIVFGWLVNIPTMCLMYVSLVGEYGLGTMSLRKTSLSAIGDVDIHCIDCTQQLSMTSSSCFPIYCSVSLARGQRALFKPILQWVPRSTATREVFILFILLVMVDQLGVTNIQLVVSWAQHTP